MQSIQTTFEIQNFPKKYPLYKKIASNITYFFSTIPFFPRQNALKRSEIRTIIRRIQTWDILLVGDFKFLSGILIEWFVTHACGYLGKWRCIHAYAQWVSYIALRKVLTKYDTAIILRPNWKNGKMKYEYCNYLVSKLWKPYDFYFWVPEEDELFFCTKLINDWLINVGYETWLRSVKSPKNLLDKALDKNIRFHRALKPWEMVYGKFEVVFYSSLIKKEGSIYTFSKPLWKLPL